MDNYHLKETLRHSRKSQRISIEALAELTDLAEGTLKRTLDNPEKASLERLNRICKALGITVVMHVGIL
jgi:transcriptional regulator with XRE-family HTH domain